MEFIQTEQGILIDNIIVSTKQKITGQWAEENFFIIRDILENKSLIRHVLNTKSDICNSVMSVFMYLKPKLIEFFLDKDFYPREKIEKDIHSIIMDCIHLFGGNNVNSQ